VQSVIAQFEIGAKFVFKGDMLYNISMSKNEITIILPCAGEGSRLGLKTPKELYEIFPGVRLIDFSLKHIRAFSCKEKLRIAVVVRPWKTEVVDYVSAQLPGIVVEAVWFDDNYMEWPGSVYSAKKLFSRYNLALLPDSYLGLVSGKKTLVESMIDSLSFHKVVFGGVDCTDPDILENLGAMRVENGLVSSFQDKPLDSLEQFNCFWGCYGFRKECGKTLYDFLIHSIQRQPLPLTEQPFYPPGTIPISVYYDLGTWENIDRFKNDIISGRLNSSITD
jgi:hypothetical protein